MAQISAVVALHSQKTFYAKRIQGNGYYPIDKFEWDESKKGWNLYHSMSDGWHFRQFIPTDAKELKFWAYMFQNSLFILSDSEMSDKSNCGVA